VEKNLTITEQINTQYKSYALYVLQSRGIPNFYDGLTPVQRLVLLNAPKQYNKTLGLVGEVIRTGLYHHSDSSLAGAISKLARPFGCSHQVLEGDGFFGSPVNPSPSAPRYTSVRINPRISEHLFKHSDLNEKNEEGGYDWIHVEFPVGLITHVVGIAVGYRSNILPRKYEDVVEYIQGQNKLLKPYFKDFTGKITKTPGSEKSWMFESVFVEDKAKKTIVISDLPPLMRYDNFIIKLTNKLELMGYDYSLKNKSQSNVNIEVVLRKVTPKEFDYVSAQIKKLTQIVVNENIVLIKDGGVKEYESVKEYLDEYRAHYHWVLLKRIQKDLSNLEIEIEYLEAKLKFLTYMSGPKRTNKEILAFISVFKDWIQKRLSRIELVKLSDDTIAETKNEIKELQKKGKELQKEMKAQEKIWKQASKAKTVKTVAKSSALFGDEEEHSPVITPDGIEIYQPEIEEEEDEFFEED
jgi:DNA gyrase/topoisomerase IV subunit A